MAHQRLVDARRSLRAVHDAGGELYVWTIDDAAEIRRLEAMGVDAVITNDPRLFGGPAGASRQRRRAAGSPIRQVAALKFAGSAPTVERWPPR